MKITLTKNCMVGGRMRPKDAIMEVDNELAKKLVRQGSAMTTLLPKEIKKVEGPITVKKPIKKGK